MTRKPEPEKQPVAEEPEKIVEEPVLEPAMEMVPETEEAEEAVRTEPEKTEIRSSGSLFGENTYVMADPHNNAD